MAAQINKIIGSKVRIEVNGEGSYEGFVHNIDGRTKQLTLVKVQSCSSGTRLHGFHQFNPKEITDLMVLEESNNAERSQLKDCEVTDEVPEENIPIHAPAELTIKKGRERSGESMHGKYTPDSSRNVFQWCKPNRDPSDKGSRMLQKAALSQNGTSVEFLDDMNNHEYMTIQPPDVVLIDSLETGFRQAIELILQQRVIGVGCEGHNVGRFGEISLIQIACNKRTYVFDILSLGREAFNSGLADIMDSDDILKVIHDCRNLSDALYHQHRVRLANVFDTQVADAFIQRNQTSDKQFPREASSLVSSLRDYLPLAPCEFDFYKVWLKHLTVDALVWRNRPLQQELVDIVSKKVMYLRELRLAQMERLMEEFINGVDVYLSCVRDASDDVAKTKQLLTKPLQDVFGKIHCRERQTTYYRNIQRELNHLTAGQNEWDDGYNFVEKYQKCAGVQISENVYEPSHAEISSNSHNIQCNVTGSGCGCGRSKRKSSSYTERNNPSSQLGDSNCNRLAKPKSSYDTGTSCAVDKPFRGRGRAESLIRYTQLPGARRPNEGHNEFPVHHGLSQRALLSERWACKFDRNGIKLATSRFPTDEELLSSSDIFGVSTPTLRRKDHN